MVNELISSFEETRKISLSKLEEQTNKIKQLTQVYSECCVYQHKSSLRATKIIVENGTSFATARKYVASNCKVAVLNFANPENPGGGVMNGAMAQEECLCRSSNLYEALICDSVFDDYYQYHRTLHSEFYSDRLIYTPGVTVFKDDSRIPKLLPENEWFTVDVITCAAPYLKQRKYTNKTVLKNIFKTRIAAIFNAAIFNHIDCIILGAFGCGAFKNPPEVVASAFHEVIEENGYGESFFDNIVFAIKSTVNDDPHTPCPNIMAFEKEFYHISAEENKLRFSDLGPSPVTMHSGEVLSGDDLVSYLEWKKQNKYYGKQFSVLGDSISTLEGYNPYGYNLFYQGENCERADVHDMQDTWWGKVIDFFGGELLVNNSWSGSRVTRLPNREELFPSGCSNERTGGLHIGTITPDVIIVYLGTNDWANNVDIDFLDYVLSGMEFEAFSQAYDIMLRKIKANYPLAEIWCCTLSTTYMSNNPSFSFPYSYRGTHIDEYNTVIKNVASMEKCNIIDLYNNNIAYDSIDGSHPNSEGMNTLASQVIRALSGNEAFQYFDCIDQKHDYIVPKEYDGGTRYTCKTGVDINDNASNDDFIEKRIADKYKILKLLDKRGWFNTYLGLNEELNKTVSVKVYDKQYHNSAMVKGAILGEFKKIMGLDHPAIPKVFDIIEDERYVFLVIEYIQGVTLDTILEKYGAQKQENVIEWAKQLCGALSYLHKHDPAYIYCDMKPSNVLLQDDGNIKIIDFGIAREYKEQKLSDTTVLGTKGYAPPEQYGGQTDPRSDIYSLGITLHYLLTGADPIMPPFEIRPIREYNPELSSGLEKIILRCTQLNPDDRFQNCDELMAALQGKYVYPVKKKGFFGKLFGK